MSFGVDALGALVEKLKTLSNDTQNMYESFIDATQLYKQGKMAEREYFARIGEYLVASSALNLLAVRVVLEMKSAMDKGTSLKNPTGGSTAPSPQAGFGVGGFVGAGGTAGPQSSGESYVMPSPSIEPTFRPVDIELPKPSSGQTGSTKNCIICGAIIPRQAKFCSKCGKSQ